ncbi:hypothetical protein K3495_g10378 [Podosphaera aphanis]|nr:hypothetical protein K3495_g10378 [Podosphaera aphanis]
MVCEILKANGDYELLGKDWISSFLRCNSRVHSVIGRKLEACRSNAAKPEDIKAFLDKFNQTCKDLNIKHSDIWNMDETGIALGVCNNSKFIASSCKKKAYVKSPETRERVSIIEAISADGRKLRWPVIFKGKNLQTTWFPSESVPNCFYTTSENGCTSKAIGNEWLKTVFIPAARSNDRTKLLVIDGHGSHTDLELMQLCKKHKIHHLFLSAHSSHILQPLDLAPISVLKSTYRNQTLDLSALNDAAPVKKEIFIKFYHETREEGLSDKIIRAGRKATRLVPFNSERVLQPSQVLQQPCTPKKARQTIYECESELKTPRNSLGAYKTQQLVEELENMSKLNRALLRNCGMALEEANTRVAASESKSKRLECQLDEAGKKDRPRKRIRLDQNQRFAGVEDIVVALGHGRFRQKTRSLHRVIL